MAILHQSMQALTREGFQNGSQAKVVPGKPGNCLLYCVQRHMFTTCVASTCRVRHRQHFILCGVRSLHWTAVAFTSTPSLAESQRSALKPLLLFKAASFLMRQAQSLFIIIFIYVNRTSHSTALDSNSNINVRSFSCNRRAVLAEVASLVCNTLCVLSIFIITPAFCSVCQHLSQCHE